MLNSFNKNAAFRFSVLFVFVFLFSGCGKKAPPVPPHHVPPPSVKNLRADIDGDRLKLFWTIPELKGNKKCPVLAKSAVYRSKTISGSDCKDCPVRFKKIADIPIQVESLKESKKYRAEYVETLEKGYRYVYKVILFSDYGIKSDDSDYIDFVY